MGENLLSGGIPPDIGSCSSLTRLRLEKNRLIGALPDFSENCSLFFMDLSDNNIQGKLPSSLENCRNVTTINLSLNNLTGFLPRELGNLMKLQALNLSHNSLGGPLPPQLGNCKKLLQFDASFNFLNGSIPSTLRSWTVLSALNLGENKLTGGVPHFLSDLKMLSELHLGGNMFGGVVPSSIGYLINLKYALNLSNNKLTGELPFTLGTLANLELLDVSQNNLSGSLDVLENMASLVEVNVSYNNFSGPIPLNLLNKSPSSFSGNPALCIDCFHATDTECKAMIRYIRPCVQQNTKSSLDSIHIAIIVLATMLFVLLLVLMICYICVRCRGRQKEDIEMLNEEGTSFLLNKIMEATDNLNEKYIIGRGAHGTVFKACLGPEKVYAVKKLEFGGKTTANNCMIREVQTLGKIRHRNLVKLEAFWLRKGYGLILYNYMESGSLRDLLQSTEPLLLTWDVRYKIALGMAQGLAYLHFDCHPAIIHRDIKPENILLDSDLEPHISDFGIAKYLNQSSTSMQSLAVLGTTGYIAPGEASRLHITVIYVCSFCIGICQETYE